MLVVAQADDLIGEETGVNLPGTDRERANWRRRLSMPAEDIFDQAERRGWAPLTTASASKAEA